MREPGEVFKVPPLGESKATTDMLLCGMACVPKLVASFIGRCEGLSFSYTDHSPYDADGPVEVEATSIIQEDSKEGSRLLIGVGQHPEDEHEHCINVVIPEHLFGVLREALYQVEKHL